MNQSPLRQGAVLSEEGDFIIEGFLMCSDPQCQATYPILEGVPIILKDIQGWWHREHDRLAGVTCKSPEICEYFDAITSTREILQKDEALLSTYMDLHYGAGEMPYPLADSAATESFWDVAVSMAQPENGERPQASLDLGCSVGRYTFEMARVTDVAVGVDLNFRAVASAAGLSRTREVRYGRRVRGKRYEEIQVPYSPPENVLFLVADALDPPFSAESFDLVAGLNLIDNVRYPLVLVGQMDALLKHGGCLILCSPYEWRHDICDPAEWLENDIYDAPSMVRKILIGDLFPQMGLRYRVQKECSDIPWVLRHHDRYWSLFLIHFLKAIKPAMTHRGTET